MKIPVRVNGSAQEVEADPDTPLVFVLRNQLGLKGTKLGCGGEQCGACTVLADGEPVMSCVRAVSEFADAEITTIEGLGTPDNPSPLQQAFIAENAAQCGYCTPGMVVSATALLREHASPSREQIETALEGNLCRCGSHTRVLKAIYRVIREGGANAD